MIVLGILVAGFAGGWVIRSSVDSTRGLAVAGVSAFYGAMERGRRLLAVEREQIEDLVAEGRSRYEIARLRSVRVSAGDGSVEAKDRSVANQEAQLRPQPDAPKRDRAA
jgi:hypothetical protein